MIIGISGKIGSGKDTVGAIIEALTDRMSTEETLHYITKCGVVNVKSLCSGDCVLCHAIEGDWEIKKFAGKLKQIASLLTGVPVEKFEDQEFKKLRMGEEWNYNSFDSICYDAIPNVYCLGDERDKQVYTYRKLLQRLGTEAMRDHIHPNVWVNALFADYRDYIECSTNEGIKEQSKWIITDVRFPNEADAVKERDGLMIRVNRVTKETLSSAPKHPSETSLDNYGEFDYVIDNNGTIEELIEKVKEILIKKKIL